jgi:hypothetical protein
MIVNLYIYGLERKYWLNYTSMINKSKEYLRSISDMMYFENFGEFTEETTQRMISRQEELTK